MVSRKELIKIIDDLKSERIKLKQEIEELKDNKIKASLFGTETQCINLFNSFKRYAELDKTSDAEKAIIIFLKYNHQNIFYKDTTNPIYFPEEGITISDDSKSYRLMKFDNITEKDSRILKINEINKNLRHENNQYSKVYSKLNEVKIPEVYLSEKFYAIEIIKGIPISKILKELDKHKDKEIIFQIYLNSLFKIVLDYLITLQFNNKFLIESSSDVTFSELGSQLLDFMSYIGLNEFSKKTADLFREISKNITYDAFKILNIIDLGSIIIDDSIDSKISLLNILDKTSSNLINDNISINELHKNLIDKIFTNLSENNLDLFISATKDNLYFLDINFKEKIQRNSLLSYLSPNIFNSLKNYSNDKILDILNHEELEQRYIIGLTEFKYVNHSKKMKSLLAWYKLNKSDKELQRKITEEASLQFKTFYLIRNKKPLPMKGIKLLDKCVANHFKNIEQVKQLVNFFYSN